MKSPYEIIKSRYITEKATTLEQLQSAESNRSIARFKQPKYVFVVDVDANKAEIASAIETMYKEKSVKVTKVNTIQAKPKPKKRGRFRKGATPRFKKAVVTLEAGDVIDNV